MPTAKQSNVKQVSEALTGKKSGVDSNKLLADLMERWGGTEKFANDLVFEFGQAEAGSLQRQKIMEMIQKLVVTNSIHNFNPPERPEDLEDDEIQERLDYYIARVAAVVAARNDDGATRGTFTPPEEGEEEPPPDF